MKIYKILAAMVILLFIVNTVSATSYDYEYYLSSHKLLRECPDDDVEYTSIETVRRLGNTTKFYIVTEEDYEDVLNLTKTFFEYNETSGTFTMLYAPQTETIIGSTGGEEEGMAYGGYSYTMTSINNTHYLVSYTNHTRYWWDYGDEVLCYNNFTIDVYNNMTKLNENPLIPFNETFSLYHENDFSPIAFMNDTDFIVCARTGNGLIFEEGEPLNLSVKAFQLNNTNYTLENTTEAQTIHIDSDSNVYPLVYRLNETHFLLSYQNVTGLKNVTFVLGEYNGSAISLTEPQEVIQRTGSYNQIQEYSVGVLNETHIAVSYVNRSAPGVRNVTLDVIKWNTTSSAFETVVANETVVNSSFDTSFSRIQVDESTESPTNYYFTILVESNLGEVALRYGFFNASSNEINWSTDVNIFCYDVASASQFATIPEEDNADSLLVVYSSVEEENIYLGHAELTTKDILKVDDDWDNTTTGWHVDKWDNIQDAVDNASEGDILLVYEGQYDENISGVPSVLIMQTILYEGESAIINYSDGDILKLGENGYINSNVIDGFTFNGSGLIDGYCGINASSTSYLTIKNCHFQNSDYAIKMYRDGDSVTGNNINNCTFDTNNYAIYAEDTYALTIDNCSMESTTTDVIHLRDQYFDAYGGTTIKNVNANNTGDDGLDADYFNYSIIQDCNFSYVNDEAVTTAIYDSTFDNLTIWGTGEHGIETEFYENFLMKNCTVLGTDAAGFYMEAGNSYNLTVENSYFASCGYSFIYIEDVDNTYIYNTTFAYGEFRGVEVCGCRNTTFESCTFFDNYWEGIDVASSLDTTLSNCIISNNNQEEWLSGAEFSWCTNITVDGCTFISNGYNGDGGYYGTDLLIMYCDDSDSTVIINGSSFFNSRSGIMFDTVENIVISNCQVYNTTMVGLAFTSSKNGLIDNCTIANCQNNVTQLPLLGYYETSAIDLNCPILLGETNYTINNTIMYGYEIGLSALAENHVNVTNCQIWNNNYSFKLLTDEIVGDDWHMDVSIWDNAIQSNNKNMHPVFWTNYLFLDPNLCNFSLNISKTEEQNILGMTYTAGNYWDYYNGTDADGDGIGDTPFNMFQDYIDEITNASSIFWGDGYSWHDADLDLIPYNYSTIYGDINESEKADIIQAFLNGSYDSFTVYNDSLPLYFTYPEPPTNATVVYDPHNDTLNFSWDRGVGSTKDVVVESYNGFGWAPWIGDERQNHTVLTSYYEENVTNYRYFQVWSYNEGARVYSQSSLQIPWGALNITVWDENQTDIPCYNYTVFITNKLGTQTHQDLNANNPHWLSLNEVPYGDDTVIVITCPYYRQRTYYMDLPLNKFYNLSLYLPPLAIGGEEGSGDEGGNVTTTKLYQLTVVGPQGEFSSTPIEDVKMTIKRYIPTNDSYESVTSLYTDANGQVDVYLIPDNVYKVTLEKDGYETKVSDYIPSNLIFTKTFRIEPEFEEPVDYDAFSISVAGTLLTSNNSLRVIYADSADGTVSASFVIYESWQGTDTQIGENSTTLNDYTFYVSGVNVTRAHKIKLTYTNSQNFAPSYDSPRWYTVAPAYLYNETGEDNGTLDLEERIENIFGEFELGWVDFISIVLAIILLVALGPYNVGLGILGAGISLAGTQALFGIYGIGFNPGLAMLSPVLIAIAFIYFWTKGDGGDRL